MNTFTDAYKLDLIQAVERVDVDAVNVAIEWVGEARDQRRHIFTCGNGGSASTASHFACDMVKGASYGREKRFRIMALTDAVPTLTAYSNDVSYSEVFVEQLRNFAESGDILFAISASGNSPNILRTVDYAKQAGCRTIALTGKDGGTLGKMADLEIRVPSPHMGRIEDAHLMICHMIAYAFIDAEVPNSALT